MDIMWVSYGYHVDIMWVSYGYNVDIMWVSYGYHVDIGGPGSSVGIATDDGLDG